MKSNSIGNYSNSEPETKDNLEMDSNIREFKSDIRVKDSTIISMTDEYDNNSNDTN